MLIRKNETHESGNVMIMVLIAIVLIGALTMVIQQGSDNQNSDISDETLAIRASEVQRYASELERAVLYVMQNNTGESDIRFAIPTDTANATGYGDLSADSDPTDQIFHPDGGAANYRKPSEDILAGASNWEFYGGTQIPQVGSDRADLIAVLPDVTKQFCDKINDLNGQTSSQPVASSGCIEEGSSGRFGAGSPANGFDDASPNTLDESSFTKLPALQACVECSGAYHFYHVLYSR